MKLLLDANLSWRLTTDLAASFGECAHVDSIGIRVPAKDAEIWNFARKNSYIIVTQDRDFCNLMDIYGFPPKVVLLSRGNCSRKATSALLLNIRPFIEDLDKNSYGLLEITE
jgi:predicted nuclease of predicted toxin-antitoxin system